jgi:serine/threonine protein phosphatase PrpC
MDQLQVHVGCASDKGRRDSNEDFCGAQQSETSRATQELVATIADGMGGGPAGRLAAETTVRGFLDGYFGLPETLGADRAASRSIEAMNRWVYSQGNHDQRLRGMATTFSALILRGRSAHVVHVGDSRIYRLREGRLQCLTQDHVHTHPDMRHVLYRAIGLEAAVRVDYARHDLRAHDRFLLCSDGVHGVLRDAELTALLATRAAPQEGARRVIERAIEAGSADNVTAVVVDAIGVPAVEHADLELASAALPVLELPKIGDIVDGFRLIEIMADGRYSRLFRAEDTGVGREVIVKFPNLRVQAEAAVRAAFVREAWIAQQVRSPYVAEVFDVAPGRQSRLYTVMPYYRGGSLEERVRRTARMPLAEGVDIGVKIGRALYALHRMRIIHRDVKPENILLGDDGLRLIDLGAARLPGIEEAPGEDIPGTPSYMAPELFAGERGDERSDVYAFGVTLYRLLSGGHYPFGEIEPFSTPRFTKRVPLGKYRPDLPAWLETCLARATAVDPQQRHGDAMELALELEHNVAHGPTMSLRRATFYERNPLRFWKIVSFLLAVALVIALASR